MTESLNYQMQKEFLVLSNLKDLETKEATNITSEKIVSKMNTNLTDWEGHKDRKSNNVKSLVSGTLSALREKGIVKQILGVTSAPIYKTTDETAVYFTNLIEELSEYLDFNHVFDRNLDTLSEEELTLYFENEYKYDIADSSKLMLTDADIKRLAFEDYKQSYLIK